MTYSLINKCAKNYYNRTFIVPVIAKKCSHMLFFETQCIIYMLRMRLTKLASLLHTNSVVTLPPMKLKNSNYSNCNKSSIMLNVTLLFTSSHNKPNELVSVLCRYQKYIIHHPLSKYETCQKFT